MLAVVDFDNPLTPLEETMAAARCEMVNRGYLFHSIYESIRIWRDFVGFAQEHSILDFSADLASQYLAYCEANNSQKGFRLRTARRALRILTDYYLHGTWDRHPRIMNNPRMPASVLAGDLEKFLDCQSISVNTMIYTRRYLTSFLLFLEDKGINDWSALAESVFEAFFAAKVHMAPRSLELISGVLRAFMRHLFIQGVVERDWTVYIPRFKGFQKMKLPSIWNNDQIEALLLAVDRVSPVGKRDYAILLLACRLGIRPSDIRTLQLDNLNWEESSIGFNLRNARPVSEHREVFLRFHAPYDPFSQQNKLYCIITKYRRLARIPIVPDVAVGMHSLRHTLASRMQQANVPLETIADILGHASLKTTRIYTHLDIAALRSVAIDPEEAHHAA